MGVAHGAHEIHVGGRAGDGQPRALIGVGFDLFQGALDEVRQLQVFEKDIEKLVLRQRELEIVLSLAAIACVFTLAAARSLGWLFNLVPGGEFLVSGMHRFARAFFAVMGKARFSSRLRRDRDFLALVDFLHGAVAQRLVHRFLDLRLGAFQETLTVPKGLALGILAPIDEVE